MERDLDDSAGNDMAELRLVHRLPHLHAEDMRGKDLVGLPVVFDDGFRDDLVIRKDGHRVGNPGGER